jgi:hypothetical protein|tara:strand:- start:1095 stop:1415 length:321 start_codon:yes stop_codon:yes gene_type:complete
MTKIVFRVLDPTPEEQPLELVVRDTWIILNGSRDVNIMSIMNDRDLFGEYFIVTLDATCNVVLEDTSEETSGYSDTLILYDLNEDAFNDDEFENNNLIDPEIFGRN